MALQRRAARVSGQKYFRARAVRRWLKLLCGQYLDLGHCGWRCWKAKKKEDLMILSDRVLRWLTGAANCSCLPARPPTLYMYKWCFPNSPLPSPPHPWLILIPCLRTPPKKLSVIFWRGYQRRWRRRKSKIDAAFGKNHVLDELVLDTWTIGSIFNSQAFIDVNRLTIKLYSVWKRIWSWAEVEPMIGQLSKPD